ncbi:MAG: protein kinase [Sandaracinus sp.]
MNQPASKSTGVDAPESLVGRTLDGRFRILSALARGGMGAVYRAEQLPLGRAVAIKILSLRHDEDQDPEFRKRFLLEASTAAKLTHPNTVRVFDYGQTDDGLYFIAMELLEGQTLKEVIAKEGALDPERAVEIAKQIARSLREAHRLGIVHRDMKPGNVMLVERGGEETVKVLDFGLAKDTGGENGEVEDITQTGVFTGSPKYMSPEQIQGEKLDARSDLYSVGVILYEMLSGRPPFVRDQPMQVLMDHIREIPKTVAAPEGKTPLPLGVVHVTMRCLAKVRDERWADMDQLLLALKEALGGAISSSSGQIAAMTGEWDAQRSGVLSLAPPLTTSSASGPNMLATSSSGALSAAANSSIPAAPPLPTSIAPPARGNGAWMALAGVFALVLALGGGWVLMGGASGPVPATTTSAPPTTQGTLPPPTHGETPPTSVVAVPTTTTVTAPATEIRTVLVSLRSQPTGAMVTLGDRTFGPTPTEVELTGDQAAEGASLHFVFSRAGFRDLPMDATVSGGTLELNARLVRIPRATTAHEETGGETTTTGDTHVEGYRDSPY